jgi:hypothetical protein
VPGGPGVEVRVPVAIFRQHLAELVQVAAGFRLGLVGAGLARAVGRVEARGDLGQLGKLGRVLRRRHRRLHLQEVDAALRRRGNALDADEFFGFLHIDRKPAQRAFVSLGHQHFGVAVDVGFGDPLGGGHLDIVVADFLVDGGDEAIGGRGVGGLRRGGRVRACAHAKSQRQRKCGTI